MMLDVLLFWKMVSLSFAGDGKVIFAFVLILNWFCFAKDPMNPLLIKFAVFKWYLDCGRH